MSAPLTNLQPRFAALLASPARSVDERVALLIANAIAAACYGVRGELRDPKAA